MSILSSIKKVAKSYVSNVVSGANIVGSALKSLVTPKPALQATLYQGLTPSQTTAAKAIIAKQSTLPNSTPLKQMLGNIIPGYSAVTNKSYSSSGIDPQAYQPTTLSRSSSGGSSLSVPSSTSYSSGLQSSVGNGISSMGSTIAPTSATGINSSLGTASIPNANGGLGNSIDATAYKDGNVAQSKGQDQAQNDFWANEQAQQQAFQKDQSSWLQNLVGDKTTRQDSEAQIRQQQDIMEYKQFAALKAGKQAEITSLEQQYATTEAAMNQQVAQESSRFGLQDFTNNRISQIKDNAAPELQLISARVNLKTAELAAINGDWAESEKFINSAVDNIMQDQTDKLDMAYKFYDINKDMFDSLSTTRQEAYKEALTTKQKDIDYQRELYKIQYSQQMQQKYSTTKTSTDLSPAQQKTYEAYKSQISTYKSKDEAMKELEKVKFGIIKAVGQSGYNSLVNDITSSTLDDTTKSWWDKLLGR